MEVKYRNKRVWKLALLLISVVFFNAASANMAYAEDDLGNKNISWGEVLYFNGHYDTEFYVDGQLAYCLQALKDVPDDGQEMTQSYYNNPNILRALYYGWAGPEQWSGFSGREHGYVTTSRVLSYYYGGDGALGESVLNSYEWEYIHYLESMPYISPMSFEPGNVKAIYDRERGLQVTPSVTVRGNGKVTLQLPEGMNLVNEESGATASGTVTIQGGSKIHLEGDAQYFHDGSWNSGEIMNIQEYAPVILRTANQDGSKQDCIRLLDKGKNTAMASALAVEWEPLGKVTIEKRSTDAETNQEISGEFYSLEGAEYTIRNEQGETITTLQMDASGRGSSIWLPYGTYQIQETVNPKGYLLDPNVYEIILDDSGMISAKGQEERSQAEHAQEEPVIENQTLILAETPQYGRIHLLKQDKETGQAHPQGLAELKGALYEVYDSQGVAKATMEIDEKGEATTENLLLGTYTIQEVKPPKGYLVDETVYTITLSSEDRETAVFIGEAASKEQIVRGDMELIKIAEDTHKRLAGIPFMITSKTTGESHIVKTDQNGYLTTRGMGILFGKDNKSDEGKNNEDKNSEEKGALLYDNYTIEEQRCEENKDYELIPAFDITISENGTVVKLGTLTNKKPERNDIPKTPEKDDREKMLQVGSVRTGDASGMAVVVLALTSVCALLIMFKCVTYLHKKKH